MPAPLAGERVRTSHYPKVRLVTKDAQETVTNSVTLQDDNEISITLEAGKTYLCRARIAFTGPAAADLRVAWASTGGITLSKLRSCYGPEAATTNTASTAMRAQAAGALDTQVAYGTDGGSSWGIAFEEFVVETVTSGAAGTLTLQWAQVTANATGTNVTAGTWLEVTEVEVI